MNFIDAAAVAPMPRRDDAHAVYTRPQRIATFLAVILPLVGLVMAVVLSWGWGISGVELALLGVMYVATAMGITIGYHRLFTHRAFETVLPVKLFFAICGSMAVQGPLLQWVAVHRRHHQHSDNELDPHSPHAYGKGVWGVVAGWWHAHIGWLFEKHPPDLPRYVRDLNKHRIWRVVSALFPVWVALGLVLPAVVGGLLTQSWTGALLGFLWGGLARVFLVHHVTWSINSVCHLWGAQPYQSGDESRNNAICGVLAMGEGWHNNHHAFPHSARHGLAWWQVDASWWVIKGLERVGLVWKIRLPTEQALAAKRMSAA